MKTARLVLGIIAMVLFLVVFLQSCLVGVGEAIIEELDGEKSVSGAAGILLAFLLLAGGIVGVAARKSKGGSIAAGILFLLASVIGFANVGKFSDLAIWSGISAAFGLVYVITGIVQKSQKKVKADNSVSANEQSPEDSLK